MRKMSEQFIGCSVSIHVLGGLGFYQGTVKTVNSSNQLITLTKVLHNGKPINKPEVTINAEDIIDLKILSTKDPKNQEASSQDANSQVTNITKVQPTSESLNLELKNKLKVGSQQHQKSSSDAINYTQDEEANVGTIRPSQNISDKPVSGFLPIQSNDESKATSSYPIVPTILKRKPRTSVGEILAYGSQSNERRSNSEKSSAFGFGAFSASHGGGGQRHNAEEKQGKRQWNKQWKNYRDETTFGTPIDEDVLNTEFDFEKNLALFDKQAVMEEIQNLKPDVVRQADRKMDKKFRCDENILSSKPQPMRQIMVPASEAGEIVYATDNGLLVPSVSVELRVNLLSTANQVGLTKSRQLEMIGRGATEIIISIIGGSHRLEPGNSHQAPVVVLLCGANTQGAAGVNCARQLECQGVQTVVITPPLPSSPSLTLLLSHEMQLYTMTSGKAITDVSTLPCTVDLIVDSRFDLHGNMGTTNQYWLNETNSYASGSRAPILALDPPSDISLPFTPRIRICPSLPLAYSPEKGKVYLLNINIPQQVFSSLNIQYTSPFGAKMVIPLHPCE